MQLGQHISKSFVAPPPATCFVGVKGNRLQLSEGLTQLVVLRRARRRVRGAVGALRDDVVNPPEPTPSRRLVQPRFGAPEEPAPPPAEEEPPEAEDEAVPSWMLTHELPMWDDDLASLPPPA